MIGAIALRDVAPLAIHEEGSNSVGSDQRQCECEYPERAKQRRGGARAPRRLSQDVAHGPYVGQRKVAIDATNLPHDGWKYGCRIDAGSHVQCELLQTGRLIVINVEKGLGLFP